MALLFSSKSDDPGEWERELAARLGDLEFRVWPETGAIDDIDVALVWQPKLGMLAELPNLKLIQSLGMGVDHIFRDPGLPPGVPVARIVDPDMANQMSEWVLMAVLHHHRMADEYARLQAARDWRSLGMPDTAATTVGIMGLGVLGADAAQKLRQLGFAVAGWSRSRKDVPGVESFHGPDGLAPFLGRSNILVCLLPLTAATENIIDAGLLAQLPKGAYIINCARGGHVVENDLLAAITAGHISGAALDVFQTEPLPGKHSFWDHPKVRVFPHISAITNPKTAADQVADNYRRMRAGEPFVNLVDRTRGY